MKCKKGIIFSLDGAIAVSIVIIMLINTTYYFTTTSKESLSQTQIVKRGYDVVAMFDEVGDLENTMQNISSIDILIPELGSNEGGYGLNASYYLPPGYDILIELYDAKKTPCPSGVCQVNLNKEGKYHVQLNAFTEDVSAGGHFLVNGVEMTRAVDTCSNCTYTSLEPLDIVENANTFTFQAVKIGTFKTHWIKILDHPDYIMTTDDTIHEVPENKFIGSGERWFASDDMAGHFEGFHKVRFKVWVV